MGLSDSLKLMRPPAENVATQTKPIEQLPEVCRPRRASLERGENQRRPPEAAHLRVNGAVHRGGVRTRERSSP